jgi:hypothetical protein
MQTQSGRIKSIRILRKKRNLRIRLLVALSSRRCHVLVAPLLTSHRSVSVGKRQRLPAREGPPVGRSLPSNIYRAEVLRR